MSATNTLPEVEELTDGSITIAGKKLNSAGVAQLIDYVRQSSNPTKYGKPTSKAMARWKLTTQMLSGVPGADEALYDFLKAKTDTKGNRSLSPMEQAVATHLGVAYSDMLEITYSDALQIFFNEILVPYVVEKAQASGPVSVKFETIEGIRKMFGGKAHVEAWGGCYPIDFTSPEKGTVISVVSHLLRNAVLAEHVLLHELAHHIEWRECHCWGYEYHDTAMGEVHRIARVHKKNDTAFDNAHSPIFYAAAQTVGLNIRNFYAPTEHNTDEILRSFADDHVEFKSKEGKVVRFPRTFFYNSGRF